MERCSTVGLSNNDESTIRNTRRNRLSTMVKTRVRELTDYENIAITACSGTRERSRVYSVVAGIAKALLRNKVTHHRERGITWRFRASFGYFSPSPLIRGMLTDK